MPYIKPQLRADLVSRDHLPNDVGTLNFTLTHEIKQFIERRGLSYATINEVIGVLECAKLELYRRIAAPYETQKALENGDVY